MLFDIRRLLLLLLILGTTTTTNGSRDSLLCNVEENGSKRNMPCKFPFILNGKTHNNCTDIQDDEGKSWCSTRVTDKAIHISSMGYWGHCSEECLQFRSSERDILESNPDGFLEDGKVCTDCRNFKECPWSSKMVKIIASLKKGNKARERLIKFVRSQKCGNGPQNVCCRSEIDQNNSSPDGSVDLSSSDNKDLGTWKPRPDNFECGTGFSPKFIIGGEDAVSDLSYMALLGYDSPLECTDILYVCGGSLINKYYVLTAAHCITDAPSEIRDVVLGEYDVGMNPDCISDGSCVPGIQKFKPSKVIVHESWDARRFSAGNDIALVRLDRPAILASEDSERSSLTPICLPWKATDPGRDLPPRESTIVAGWGEVTNNFTESKAGYCLLNAATRRLQRVSLPLNSHEDCSDAFPLLKVNHTLQICAGGEPDKDSCNSDSGGPLLYKENESSETPIFQIGVVSFGTRPCGIRKPGIYTRITAYLEWIKDSMEP